MQNLTLKENIKILIKRLRAERKIEEADYDEETSEDNFSEGYIRALELFEKDLKHIIKISK